MTEDLVNFLLTEARPRILTVARRDSCIFSTRVAVGFLRRFGVQARALAVSLMINSPELERRLGAYRAAHDGTNPPNGLVTEWMHVEPGSKCWSIAVGLGDPHPRDDAFDGHLVALVEESMLIDLSLDQANRPERDINLQPLRVPLHEFAAAFIDGRQAIFGTCDDGAGLCYCALDASRPGADIWLRSKDWFEHARTRPLIDTLAAQFRAKHQGVI